MRVYIENTLYKNYIKYLYYIIDWHAKIKLQILLKTICQID